MPSHAQDDYDHLRESADAAADAALAKFTQEIDPDLARRKYSEGCSTCTYVKVLDGFGPMHDASPRCESGAYSHCSCDTCF